jgi:hypothetical protein
MKTSDAIPSSVEEGRKEWAREAMSSQKLVSHGKETRKASGITKVNARQPIELGQWKARNEDSQRVVDHNLV